MAERIGVLWRKESKEGVTYYSGILNTGFGRSVNIAVFHNHKKDPDSKEPDCHIVVSNSSPQGE